MPEQSVPEVGSRWAARNPVHAATAVPVTVARVVVAYQYDNGTMQWEKPLDTFVSDFEPAPDPIEPGSAWVRMDDISWGRHFVVYEVRNGRVFGRSTDYDNPDPDQWYGDDREEELFRKRYGRKAD